jgi:hypothetical protein
LFYGAEVAFGAFDAKSEKIDEATDVLGGDCFVEDAVFAECLGGESEGAVDPDVADLGCSDGRLDVDEEVRVDALRPCPASVVQPCREAPSGGVS